MLSRDNHDGHRTPQAAARRINTSFHELAGTLRNATPRGSDIRPHPHMWLVTRREASVAPTHVYQSSERPLEHHGAEWRADPHF